MTEQPTSSFFARFSKRNNLWIGLTFFILTAVSPGHVFPAVLSPSAHGSEPIAKPVVEEGPVSETHPTKEIVILGFRALSPLDQKAVLDVLAPSLKDGKASANGEPERVAVGRKTADPRSTTYADTPTQSAQAKFPPAQQPPSSPWVSREELADLVAHHFPGLSGLQQSNRPELVGHTNEVRPPTSIAHSLSHDQETNKPDEFLTFDSQVAEQYPAIVTGTPKHRSFVFPLDGQETIDLVIETRLPLTKGEGWNQFKSGEAGVGLLGDLANGKNRVEIADVPRGHYHFNLHTADGYALELSGSGENQMNYEVRINGLPIPLGCGFYNPLVNASNFCIVVK